ncbi:hypothetical protein ACNOYE_00845 [Nannocystaceae bacterium ST9]
MHGLATLAPLLAIALLIGCGETRCPPIGDPIGPDFYATSPGLCAGDCSSLHVHREGAKVQLIVSEADACEVRGTLSAELVADIDELHAALLAGELEAGEPTCNHPDVGQTWLEFDESLSFAYATSCPPEGLAELDQRLAAALWALGECRTTDDVTPAKPCKDAY